MPWQVEPAALCWFNKLRGMLTTSKGMLLSQAVDSGGGIQAQGPTEGGRQDNCRLWQCDGCVLAIERALSFLCQRQETFLSQYPNTVQIFTFGRGWLLLFRNTHTLFWLKSIHLLTKIKAELTVSMFFCCSPSRQPFFDLMGHAFGPLRLTQLKKCWHFIQLSASIQKMGIVWSTSIRVTLRVMVLVLGFMIS